ncbi:6-carboxytetrahydropterin synthase [Halomonas sp. EGI 63088]|uniref:6-carboxytetrahydropterin synthase n=1 Tax=Halomonas flagellata TaxID=2920385 RepID=A0ABS9RVS6_9GAMM|nr:6-carboxytetrahydropterin synthase [Halomonas flagellata]MCH4563953.1 6-carboxytetrahydropterin synthase [Halomonas flagellata]
MYRLNVRDHFMIAHGLHSEIFGPVRRIHGASYVIDVGFQLDAMSVTLYESHLSWTGCEDKS